MTPTAAISRRSNDAFRQALAEYRIATGQTHRDVILEEAALCARDAMIYTPPMPGSQGGMRSTDKGKGGKGLSLDARRAGDAAIARDILSIFRKPTPISFLGELALSVEEKNASDFAKIRNRPEGRTVTNEILKKIIADPDPDRAFQKATNLFNRTSGTLRAAISEAEIQKGGKFTGDLRSYHDWVRSQYRGRITRHGGPRNRGIKPVKVDARAIESYIKSRQLRVGYMKAGWRESIAMLPKPKINGIEKNFGVKGIPSWVSRHFGGNGYVYMNGKPGTKFGLLIGNKIGDILGIGREADVLNLVIDGRIGKLEKRAAHFFEKHAKRFNRK